MLVRNPDFTVVKFAEDVSQILQKKTLQYLKSRACHLHSAFNSPVGGLAVGDCFSLDSLMAFHPYIQRLEEYQQAKMTCYRKTEFGYLLKNHANRLC